MYLSKKVSNALFSVNDDGKKILFKAENFGEPLRIYLVANEKTVYAGLTEPCKNGYELLYRYNEKPDRIIAVRGVLSENHETICEFEFSAPSACRKTQDYAKYIFSHPAACDCVKYYAHFHIFQYGGGAVLAFPSAADMHPLLHLIPFTFWYPVNFGSGHTGYYFVGISKKHEPFFVSEEILTEIIGNNKIEKAE